MHNERHSRIRLRLQHDRGSLNRESIASIRHVGRNFVVEDGVERSRAPILCGHPVVGARQGLHSTTQRLYVTRRISAFSVSLPDETPNESEHIADPMIELVERVPSRPQGRLSPPAGARCEARLARRDKAPRRALGALSRFAQLARGLQRLLRARFLQARLERRHKINNLSLGALIARRLFNIE